MIKVKHILKEDGDFFCCAEIRARYGEVINFLGYYSICNGFDINFRRIIKINSPVGNQKYDYLGEALTSEHLSRDVYNILSEDKYAIE